MTKSEEQNRMDLMEKCDELMHSLDDANADISGMYKDIQKMRLQIAYQDGILRGLGFTDGKSKSKRDDDIDFEAAVHRENMEEELDCDCSICQIPDQKRRNLLHSSADIQKWADENDVDVDPGDCNDN